MIMNEKSVDQKMSICHSGVHPINSDFFYFQILFLKIRLVKKDKVNFTVEWCL